MAIKVGTDNKRNVVIAIVLFCVVLYLAITQIFGGPAKPAPVAVVSKPMTIRPSPAAVESAAARSAAGGVATSSGGAPEAKKLPNMGLDPALHLDKLALSESIQYAGDGRNIFSAESAPVVIDRPLAPARPQDVAVNTGPPLPPPPPEIDLKFFGYSASKDGKREAFLLHGDDIFEASAGEIVSHRYKVVSVDPRSIQVTDMNYNNTQTLPLIGN
jgi:hypothetical protein